MQVAGIVSRGYATLGVLSADDLVLVAEGWADCANVAGIEEQNGSEGLGLPELRWWLGVGEGFSRSTYAQNSPLNQVASPAPCRPRIIVYSIYRPPPASPPHPPPALTTRSGMQAFAQQPSPPAPRAQSLGTSHISANSSTPANRHQIPTRPNLPQHHRKNIWATPLWIHSRPPPSPNYPRWTLSPPWHISPKHSKPLAQTSYT